MKHRTPEVKDRVAASRPQLRRPKRDIGHLKAKPLPRAQLLRLLKEEPAPPEFWNDPVDPSRP